MEAACCGRDGGGGGASCLTSNLENWQWLHLVCVPQSGPGDEDVSAGHLFWRQQANCRTAGTGKKGRQLSRDISTLGQPGNQIQHHRDPLTACGGLTLDPGPDHGVRGWSTDLLILPETSAREGCRFGVLTSWHLGLPPGQQPERIRYRDFS